MTNTTKTAKVIAALEDGAELTAKQINARYRVKNARALISSIRMQGYPVYLNKRVSTFDGETYTGAVVKTLVGGRTVFAQDAASGSVLR